MDEFISDLQSTHWWLSAIIVGDYYEFYDNASSKVTGCSVGNDFKLVEAKGSRSKKSFSST